MNGQQGEGRPAFSPLRREKLSEGVAERLRAQIRDGGLRAGQRLPGHRELADAFGVGLSSVREAISMLASEGLVETRAGRGTFVRRPQGAIAIVSGGRELTRREVEELIEARELLELQLVAMAAERASAPDVARLRRHVEAMAVADEAAAFAEADLALHLAIADAARNRFLRQAVEQIRGLMRQSMEVSFATLEHRSETAEVSVESHRRLVEAIDAGRPDAAREVLAQILSRHHDLVLGAGDAGG